MAPGLNDEQAFILAPTFLKAMETWSPSKGLTWLTLNDLSGRDDSETGFLSKLSVEQTEVKTSG